MDIEPEYDLHITAYRKATLLGQLAKERQSETFEGYSRHYLNFSDILCGYYECDHVVPWTISAFNVNADLMLISQDWASEEFLLETGKNPDQKRFGQVRDLPTNRKTQEMLKRHFRICFEQTYATDAFAFIKPGEMNGALNSADLVRSTRRYALRQIEIVRPKMVLCLGSAPFNAIRKAKGQRGRLNLTKAFQVEMPPHTEFLGIPIFAVAHPGGTGTRAVGGWVNAEPRWAALGAYFQSRPGERIR